MHLDWTTLALQAVNVLVLIWLLRRFLYEPVAAIVARRQDEAAKLLADAAAARQQAQAEKEALAAARAGIAGEREQALAGAAKAAEAECAAALAHAQDEMFRLRAEAHASIARERNEAEAALMVDAGRLAARIARRLLTRLPPAASFEPFLADLGQAVAGLPEATRAALDSQPAELVTAVPLSRAEAERAVAVLAQALGRKSVRVTFRVDSALIAGVELHAAHLVVRNSWAADLERILGELKSDDDGTGRAEPVAGSGDGTGGRRPAGAHG